MLEAGSTYAMMEPMGTRGRCPLRVPHLRHLLMDVESWERGLWAQALLWGWVTGSTGCPAAGFQCHHGQQKRQITRGCAIYPSTAPMQDPAMPGCCTLPWGNRGSSCPTGPRWTLVPPGHDHQSKRSRRFWRPLHRSGASAGVGICTHSAKPTRHPCWGHQGGSLTSGHS